MNTKLKVGFGRIVCLPDDPIVHIAGNDAKTDRNTDGIRDELAVTCIALSQEEKKWLIYTCDTVTINEFYVSIKEMVTAATGVPGENIVLNATHTHSAPTLKHDLPGRDAYLAKFREACVEAAVAAVADLWDAELSYGSAKTENLVFVRHYWMNDGTSFGNGHGSTESGFKAHMYDADPECQVLKFAREGKKDIVLFNLPCHATICSGKELKTKLSADFPYYARTYVEQQTEALCAYFIAAGGDSIPGSRLGLCPYSKDPAGFGAALGESVLSALKNMSAAEGNEIAL